MIAYALLLVILIVMYCRGIHYRNNFLEKVDKKKYILYFIFPVVAYWLERVKFFRKERVKRKIEDYRMLHPGIDARKLFYLETYQRFSMFYSILFILSVICLGLQGMNRAVTSNELFIQRPAIGMSQQEKQIKVILTEKEKKVESTFSIKVPAMEYSSEEIESFRKKAKEYVLAHVKGQNSSLDNITSSLSFITGVPENPFKISWETSDQEYINEDGTLNNKELSEKEYVTIRACLSYMDSEEYLEIPVGVAPYTWTWEETVKEQFLNMAEEKGGKNKQERGYRLPERIGNIDVTYVKTVEDKSKKAALSMLLLCVGIWGYWESTFKKEKRKYREECERVYPDLVYKLTLLLGAGMTLRAAWFRIISDYMKEKSEKTKKSLYAYEEMMITWNEIENGIPEIEAFERFGKRIKLRNYLRLSALISQNMKKGTKGFLNQLEREAKEAQEEKNQMARKLGEEAGTKLLFPMLIMLVIVLVIVMIPAFLSFSKGGL